MLTLEVLNNSLFLAKDIKKSQPGTGQQRSAN